MLRVFSLVQLEGISVFHFGQGPVSQLVLGAGDFQGLDIADLRDAG